MEDETRRHAIRTVVDLPYPKAVERTRAELVQEGFGVLCEIDVAATLKKKLEVDFGPYVILGACNPALAHQALEAERDIGLLLPCNVVVYAETSVRSVVAAMDPEEALALTGNQSVRAVATAVKERLRRVVERVSAAALGAVGEQDHGQQA